LRSVGHTFILDPRRLTNQRLQPTALGAIIKGRLKRGR
jgi:hypothetical protein